MGVTLAKSNLLTKEEEYTLVSEAQGSNPAARQRARSILMEKNQGLVHGVVHRFPLKNAQVGYDDLWQQGCIGFLHAVDKFELDRGHRLSTYAYRWIHAFIRRFYQNQGRVVRIPAHLADRKFQLDREVQKLALSLGRVPTQEEVEELVPGYTDLCGTFAYTVSLNQELESGEEVLDLQADTGVSDDTLQVGSLLDLLREEVSERDYNIFVRRYGVDGFAEHSLSEISIVYKISRARTHQICNSCLTSIRKVMD